jgi:hypothetical protein
VSSVNAKSLSILSWENFDSALALATSHTLQKSVIGLSKEINKKLTDTFFTPDRPERLAVFSFKKQKNRIYSAELFYRFKAIPLSKYPVRQYRVTTGNQIIKVTRLKGKSFRTSLDNHHAVATYVQIRRAGRMKLVQDKVGLHGDPKGLKGFLHTGRALGPKSFSAKIFKRQQQATWSNGQRLPIRQLFGPSISQLVLTKEVQSTIDESKFTKDLNKIFGEEFVW